MIINLIGHSFLNSNFREAFFITFADTSSGAKCKSIVVFQDAVTHVTKSGENHTTLMK